ncbi:MAG: hypothetical protein ACKVT1_09150 [Dehalococcoidia bacterium]
MEKVTLLVAGSVFGGVLLAGALVRPGTTDHGNAGSPAPLSSVAAGAAVSAATPAAGHAAAITSDTVSLATSPGPAGDDDHEDGIEREDDD